jgi:hypothetical protein
MHFKHCRKFHQSNFPAKIFSEFSKFCSVLYQHFYGVPHTRVINGNFLSHSKGVDCVILCGNTMGVAESDNVLYDYVEK